MLLYINTQFVFIAPYILRKYNIYIFLLIRLSISGITRLQKIHFPEFKAMPSNVLLSLNYITQSCVDDWCIKP